MIEIMTDEQITNDSRRLSEIIFQIGAMRDYSYRLAFTIVAYAVMYFILALSKQAGFDEHEEARNFVQFLGNVLKVWDGVAEEQKGGN